MAVKSPETPSGCGSLPVRAAHPESEGGPLRAVGSMALTPARLALKLSATGAGELLPPIRRHRACHEGARPFYAVIGREYDSRR